MPSSGETGEDLPDRGPQHEERDQLCDGAGRGEVPLTDCGSQLRRVAAHEGDEEAAEIEVTEHVNHARKRRQ